MASDYLAPGVYVETGPHAAPPITSAPTSIAAFIGRCPRGPVNEPVMLTGMQDFARVFGSLEDQLPLGQAVRDFFTNGGSRAVVVRLQGAGHDGRARLDVDGLALVAANPGSWGNGLRVRVMHMGGRARGRTRRTRARGEQSLRFDLLIEDAGSRRGERHRDVDVSIGAGKRRIDRILSERSELVRVASNSDGEPLLPRRAPAHGATATSWGGADSLPLDADAYRGDEQERSGLFALEKADTFNLLCIPPDTKTGDIDPSVWAEAAAYCVRRRAFLIVDPPASWTADPATAASVATRAVVDSPPVPGYDARNAALFFPRVIRDVPADAGRGGVAAACGMVAGIIARTDAVRGVWKAPAGRDAALQGVGGLELDLTDAENGQLNVNGINAIRRFPGLGPVLWGGRTLRGADRFADEYKYIAVRRLALHIEESLIRGTGWAVFEPGGETLWARLRAAVSDFMDGLFRKGAFQGSSPRDAYFVKCDVTTNTATDVDRGLVNILVGFAPLRPAEFVIIRIQQKTGQGG